MLAALWIGVDVMERALLIGAVLAVLVVAWLRAAIVAAVGPHDAAEPASPAQDMGLAALVLSVLLAMLLWGAAGWERLGQ